MKARCDFHVHTCLSPCGDLSSSPRAMVRAAVEKHISVIAVCDHNSALNCRPAMAAGNTCGVTVIPGLEVSTREEAHILALFPELEYALELSSLILPLLPLLPVSRNNVHFDQVWVDEDEVILGEVDRFLAAGADIGTEDILDFVHIRGGLVIPAHIDKPVFSLPSQLGIFPELDFDAVEISRPDGYGPVSGLSGKYPVITSSDAHFPEDLGKRGVELDTLSCSFADIKAALKEGRFIRFFN